METGQVFLIGNGLSCLQCEQSAKHFIEGVKKIEDNMNQDFRNSRFSTEDLEFSDLAYTLLALLCKDESSAYVRSAEDGIGCHSMASPPESTNSRECDKPLESVAGTNIHVTRPKNQYSTMEPKC